nr:peptidase inhibitor 16 [Loxodonta africana]
MHSSHSLLLLLLPLLLLATTGPAGALTEEEKRLVVEAHNFYRAQTNPPAANMLKMLWDEELAVFAKAYAEHCVWAHNPHRGRRGENLFAIMGDSMDVQMAVAEWHRERDYYNFTTGACQPGQMCGHYTQVVWAKTERVGCDSHLCAKLQNVEDSNVHFLVCNYVPPGNVIGQKLYEVGPPCSACPRGYHCEQSLCEPIRVPEEPQDLPCLMTEAQTSLATEASGSSKMGASSSLATEAPPFLVTEAPASLATKALPTGRTEATSSLAMKDFPSMATEALSASAMKDPPSKTTEAPPSLTTEVSSFLATHSLLSLEEKPVNFPKSTHAPLPKSADKVAIRTSVPSMSSEESLYPKVSLTGRRQPLPHAQEKAEAEGPHELRPLDEFLASVFPAQGDPDELQATPVHMGQTSSRSLPNSPNTFANANAIDGRTLALQSSLPGKACVVCSPHPPGSSMSALCPQHGWYGLGGSMHPLLRNGCEVGERSGVEVSRLRQSLSFAAGADLPEGAVTESELNPNPAMPNPAGPSPAGPNLEKPNPLGQDIEGSSPAQLNPAGSNPTGPGPSQAGPNPVGPNWAEPNPAGPSPEGPNAAEPGSEELNPAEPGELNPEEVESLNPEELEEPNLGEPNLGEPNLEEPNLEGPNAEEPNAEEPNLEEPDVGHPTVEDPNAEEPPNEGHPTVEDPNAEEPPDAGHTTAEDPNAEKPPTAEEEPKPTRPKPNKPMIHLKPKPSTFNSAPGCGWSPLLGPLLLLPLALAGIF